ncbi:MAG: amidohydrolase family protein [Candidatus Lernaella stagnicola]|nr:amidohydrolase family protein [Candidatus Lernaella stagnicola]
MMQWKPAAVTQKPLAPIAVDCHVHLFPDDLFAAIANWFKAVGWNLPYPPKTADVLRHLEHFGVERFWALPYAHKPGIARGLNEYLAEQAGQHPQIVPFFTVHPEDDVRAEAEYAVNTLGSRGMKIHAEVQQVGLHDSRLDPAFDLLEERGMPCVLHAGNEPYPDKRAVLDFDNTRRRLEKNPNLTAVIAHLGAPDTAAYLALLDRFPNLHLEVSFTNVPPMIQVQDPAPAALAPYAERLLYGSDFPYITFPYAWQADAWARLDWVKEHHKSFFGGTANRLIGV